MAGTLFIWLFFGVLVVVSGDVTRRDAPPATPATFSEIANNVENQLKEIQTVVLNWFDLKNPQELEERAKQTGHRFVEAADNFASFVKKETESLQDDPLVQKVRQAADDLVEQTKQKHPETYAEVGKIQDNVNMLINNLKELGSSQEAANLRKTLDEIIQLGKTKFETAIEDIKKTVSKQ